MKYLYYPGCSLKGNGIAYEVSFLAVFKALGVEVQEMEDWNCCGATAVLAVDETEATAMAARNLAIAEQSGLDIMAPCSGCYLVLEKTRRYMEQYPELSERVRGGLKEVGLDYKGTVKVKHPLEVLYKEIGLEELKKHVKRPLKDLRVAPYYGCQIVRPYSGLDNQHNPMFMDHLLEACGATVVEYPLKTKCCGALVGGTVPEMGLQQIFYLLKEAKRRKADIVATICSLCNFNLDSFQPLIATQFEDVTIPVVYITQLIGLALGIPANELALEKHSVPSRPVLSPFATAGV